MLQIAFIRENPGFVKQRLEVKNFKNLELVDKIIEKDAQRRISQKKRDDLLSESNALAKEIGNLYKQQKKDEAEALKQKANALKEEIKNAEETLRNIEQEINDLLLLLPNLPNERVTRGESAKDNLIVEEHANVSQFSDNLLPHWELCERFDLIDFETGSKITGSGFPVYRGKMAKFQRALINFFIDEAVMAGYFEIQPPYLVNEDSAFGTGQLPDKDGQMYYIQEDNFYLIPTAEVPVTNLLRDTILKEKDFPFKFVAYSACFRREAGSYGKDVRGLNRLHQFDKVEIVRIETPENSYKALEEMCNHVKSLLFKLELPFRIVQLCGGDMSFASALTYDFEVYAAGQKRWLEVSSVSNFETFQSVRMKLRYKNDEGKTFYPHTLNGSALALPRIVAAIIENNQSEKGIRVPEVLVKYTGFEYINNLQ